MQETTVPQWNHRGGFLPRTLERYREGVGAPGERIRSRDGLVQLDAMDKLGMGRGRMSSRRLTAD